MTASLILDARLYCDMERTSVGVSGSNDGASSGELAEAWAAACRRLRASLGEAVFSAWFARLNLVRVEDETAYLSVPTTFLKTWIQSHYVDRIVAALAAELSGVSRAVITLRSSSRATPRRIAEPQAKFLELRPEAVPSEKSAPVASDSRAAEPTVAEGLGGSPLDRRLTFASFLVGRSNQLAQIAAERVAKAKAGDPPLYSPLYVHAGVGLGKTHLLQATAHAVAESGRRVIYLTAEKFMYGFVASLKSQTAIAF